MAAEKRDEELVVPEDLDAALGADPHAAAIWDGLPEAHRRGHVIAIERITDAEARAEQIRHTVEHLFEKHAS
jgi:uncharacterized protein YdeI (YjbR/CyaY-like superfamily)